MRVEGRTGVEGDESRRRRQQQPQPEQAGCLLALKHASVLPRRSLQNGLKLYYDCRPRLRSLAFPRMGPQSVD
eukprot:211966-Pyramimonas_sp.AAC.1